MMRNVLMMLCALWLLLGCGADKGERLRQLEMLEQMNRADSVMKNDSLAEDLVAYFDKKGTPNERMRAYYMLGRTYFDLGELPRALETYLQAADCADTTATDCDYKTLSRIHAQSAEIYNLQIQPRSQLKELRLAEYYAKNVSDTLMAIECYAQQADAHSFLQNYDSVIFIREQASKMYMKANKKDRSALTIGGAITSLLRKKEINKAKQYIDYYEKYSGTVDSLGNVKNGRKIHYYIKGEYYLAAGKIDSAEYMFRRLLSEGLTLNHQIAGNKGLQEVYERRGISDSIAKYAKLGYELNDSAYLLSEMQNIQKFQASYNYNHNKNLAEQKKLEAKILLLILLFVIVIVIVVGFLFIKRYLTYKKEALDYRLRNADISLHLREMAQQNPAQIPSFADWHNLRNLVENEIPSFYLILNSNREQPLSDFEYDVCLALRVQLSPAEIAKLKSCTPAYITKVRKKLLLQIFDREDTADVFDREIIKIRKNNIRKIHLLNIVKSFNRHLFGRE
ncbi:MAG: hypothetical protein J6W38_07090 [Prevotella sp.]|nr:hypothetical protein [Prevotella sp.]MBO7128955.1 hypothetical protein [Prevotella sp.]